MHYFVQFVCSPLGMLSMHHFEQWNNSRITIFGLQKHGILSLFILTRMFRSCNVVIFREAINFHLLSTFQTNIHRRAVHTKK